MSPALVDLLTLVDLRVPALLEETLVGVWLGVGLGPEARFRAMARLCA
jgi:hypothetical protein